MSVRLQAECPHCKQSVKPKVISMVNAMPTAIPAVPARLICNCPNCNLIFYAINE